MHDEHCDEDCDIPTEEYGNDPKEEMQGRINRAEKNRRWNGDRPHETAHLVRGEMAAIGYDGEPLLNHVRRVGDWIDHRHLFIPGAEKHRLARDEHDEDYEPPEETPPFRHEASAAAAGDDWRGDWPDYHFDPEHPALEGMHEVAGHSPDFKTFLNQHILRHNYHGRYWHLTDDPNFEIRHDYAPREGSSMGDENEEHGLMVSTDPESWHEYMPHRRYAAEIALHGKPGEDYENTTRGFGHEIWVNSTHKAEVLGVHPYEEGMRKHNHFYSRVVPSTEDDFRKIWDRAHDQHDPKTAATGYQDLTPRSAMIYLEIPEGLVGQVPGGVDDHHITLVYLGKNVGDEAFAEACRRTRDAAAKIPPLEGVLHGIDTFEPSDSSDGKVPAFVPAYIPGIGKLRQLLEDLSASEHRHYRPHLTLGYYEPDEDLPAPHPPVQVRFGRLHVKRGDEVASFPLGERPMTAQAAERRMPTEETWKARRDRVDKFLQAQGDGTMPIRSSWGPHTPNYVAHGLIADHDGPVRDEHWEHLPDEYVSLRQPIHTHQAFVYPEAVRHYLHADDDPDSYPDSGEYTPGGDEPKVVRHEGTHYLLDGHHRYVKDRLMGHDSMTAKVFDTANPEHKQSNCYECHRDEAEDDYDHDSDECPTCRQHGWQVW